MHPANLQSTAIWSDPDDPGADSVCGDDTGGQSWQSRWWAAWLTPMPTWLERLERGAPLPRRLRR